MSPFVFNTTASIVFEPGSAKRLGQIVAWRPKRDPLRDILFVTDLGLRRMGLAIYQAAF